MLKYIDFHTHIHPDKVAHKATENILGFYGIEPHGMVSTAECLLERDKKAGIEGSVILPVAMRADQVRHINEFIINETAAHKEFFGFGTVHPDMENIGDEVDFIKASGLLGVKFHSDMQCCGIDDERFFPLFEAASGRLPVMVHCGDPRYDYSHPKRLKRVLELFPKLTVIAAHFGGWSLFDEALACLKDKDCFLDTSSSIQYMNEGQAESLIGAYGAERMLFGSDFPVWDPKVELERFLALGISDEDKERIAYKNACELLGKKIKIYS